MFMDVLLTLNRWFCRTGNYYYADVLSAVILVVFYWMVSCYSWH